MPRPDRRELLAIAAGGAAGALARTAVVQADLVAPGRWPWPTLAVNVLGAVLLGWVATRLQEPLPLSAYRRPLLGTGLCGALTTFSAVQVELLKLLRHDEVAIAVGYTCGSLAAGLIGVYLATALTRRARLR